MTISPNYPLALRTRCSSAQSTFRSVMDAMARPGSVQRIAAAARPPPPMMRGTAAIALTLFDHDTPIWLDARDVGDTGCREMAQVPHQRACGRGFLRSAVLR